MKWIISAPSGYNARELLIPLRQHLEADDAVHEIHVITPAAAHKETFFPSFSSKFHWHANPADLDGHTALVSTIKPNVVLTPTNGLDTLDTPILRAAKQANVPAVTFVASWDNVFKMERLVERGHSGAAKSFGGGYEVPDYFAVWNAMNKEHVGHLFPEVPSDNIAITGPPRFDYFTHTDRIPDKEQLLAYLAMSPTPDAKLIHCATTELYPFDYIIKHIAAAANKKQFSHPINLYASVHPGGDITRHQHYQRYGAAVRYSFGRRQHSPLPAFAYLPTDEEIYLHVALFLHTDVLVNQSSTVAIESLRADVPVVNVKYGKRFDSWRWRRSMVYRDFRQHYRYITGAGATTIARNSHQLIKAINGYIDDPTRHQAARRQTVRKLLTLTDGTAGRRLIEFVKQAAI